MVGSRCEKLGYALVLGLCACGSETRPDNVSTPTDLCPLGNCTAPAATGNPVDPNAVDPNVTGNTPLPVEPIAGAPAMDPVDPMMMDVIDPVMMPTGDSGPFPAVTDFAASGPFQTTSVSDTGPDGTFSLHHPANLGQDGLLHPMITWGNGTGTTSVSYQQFLVHLASHGFIVIASNNTNVGSGAEMRAGLDWVIAGHTDSSSPFFGVVNVNSAGATGHSQGGGGSINAGAHPAVLATVPIEPSPGDTGGLHGPMLLYAGGMDGIVSKTALVDPIFARATVPTFYATLIAANHFTPIGNIGDFRAPATAWFRLHLMGDESARPMFYGDSCSLCSNSAWLIERKNM